MQIQFLCFRGTFLSSERSHASPLLAVLPRAWPAQGSALEGPEAVRAPFLGSLPNALRFVELDPGRRRRVTPCLVSGRLAGTRALCCEGPCAGGLGPGHERLWGRLWGPRSRRPPAGKAPAASAALGPTLLRRQREEGCPGAAGPRGGRPVTSFHRAISGPPEWTGFPRGRAARAGLPVGTPGTTRWESARKDEGKRTWTPPARAPRSPATGRRCARPPLPLCTLGPVLPGAGVSQCPGDRQRTRASCTFAQGPLCCGPPPGLSPAVLTGPGSQAMAFRSPRGDHEEAGARLGSAVTPPHPAPPEGRPQGQTERRDTTVATGVGATAAALPVLAELTARCPGSDTCVFTVCCGPGAARSCRLSPILRGRCVTSLVAPSWKKPSVFQSAGGQWGSGP